MSKLPLSLSLFFFFSSRDDWNNQSRIFNDRSGLFYNELLLKPPWRLWTVFWLTDKNIWLKLLPGNVGNPCQIPTILFLNAALFFFPLSPLFFYQNKLALSLNRERIVPLRFACVCPRGRPFQKQKGAAGGLWTWTPPLSISREGKSPVGHFFSLSLFLSLLFLYRRLKNK